MSITSLQIGQNKISIFDVPDYSNYESVTWNPSTSTTIKDDTFIAPFDGWFEYQARGANQSAFISIRFTRNNSDSLWQVTRNDTELHTGLFKVLKNDSILVRSFSMSTEKAYIKFYHTK